MGRMNDLYIELLEKHGCDSCKSEEGLANDSFRTCKCGQEIMRLRGNHGI